MRCGVENVLPEIMQRYGFQWQRFADLFLEIDRLRKGVVSEVDLHAWVVASHRCVCFPSAAAAMIHIIFIHAHHCYRITYEAPWRGSPCSSMRSASLCARACRGSGAPRS